MTQIYPPRSPVPPAPAKPDHAVRIAAAVDHAQELYELPGVQSARFLAVKSKGVSTLVLSLSQRSLSALSKRSSTQTLLLNDADSSVVAATPVVSTSDEVKHVAVAPNGERQAVFRVIPGKDGKEARKVIEIVRVLDGLKEDEIEVSKDHGDFYFDATFGPPVWHPSSAALVYTAEAPTPKPDPVATRPSDNKFRYTPDFGETFTGKREPTLFLLLLADSSFQEGLQLGPDEKAAISTHRLTSPELAGPVVFGQPAFLPTADKPQLVATGYAPTGDDRKLGIVYCSNRPARIYTLDVAAHKAEAGPDADGKAEDDKHVYRAVQAKPLSSPDRSARSPRIVPTASSESNNSNSTRVLYLSNALGGPHASCAALQLATVSHGSLTLESDRTLVPVVDVPETKSGSSDPFPGLYVDQLPQECFLRSPSSGDNALKAVMSSIWRSRRVPLTVDLESGEVQNLAPWPEQRQDVDAALPFLYLGKKGAAENALDSFGVLGTDGAGRVVALRSGPGQMPRLVLAQVGSGEVEWKVLKDAPASEKLAAALSRIMYTVLPLPKFEPTELILISPIPIDPTAEAHVNLPPLITIPHGGPHSTSTTDFNYSVAASVLAGYRVCLVNYPGSLGFGQRNVEVLPPRLGELEVEATVAAGHYLNALSLASRTAGKRLMMGGSHGGWTTCHATARWPDDFDACVMRNPVTDLVANASMTDIPDWVYTEADFAYPLDAPPALVSPADFERLHAISPLRHAGQVKAPTLLLIGLDDRRVPPNQGRAWFHALKRRKEGEHKVDVEMLTFPGNGHPIAETVEAEWVAFESGLRWLAKYTDFE
ncbi:hypothetical protein Rhopal_007503-T1 [Rhodotorula paludigena]|uniref:acylaminoacyl-peptidase n=1 Tax=Rhodotorula paludigena TaxID=86838 RepID=A0AAV5GVW8_9BASI|nr:hypothetical protein Rhopal_007503-T1 [Rhodotorula paludigena]